MRPKPRLGWDEIDEEIAELEAELDHTYQVIENLRLQNVQLKKQIDYLKKREKQQQEKLKRKRVPPPSSPNRKPKPRQASGKTPRRRVSKRRVKLSCLQFIVLAIAVATIFTTLGLFVTRLIIQRPTRPSVEPSPTVPQTLYIPPSPPIFSDLPQAASQPVPSRLPGRENSEVVYNLTSPPNFQQSARLQAIVDEIVRLVAVRNFPKKPLSITLIDVKRQEIAGYKQNQLRYPASVIKMFWMTVAYAQIENSIWENESDFNIYISKMIHDSDNQAASFILDSITNTESGSKQSEAEFQAWLNKRQQVNRFFQAAGYENININQKTYPVYYLKLPEPKGIDLQMRGDPQNPIRNQITTDHAARLIYEICATGEAVSRAASEKMCGWLIRDLRPEVWKKQWQDPGDFNPIRGFFGESLTKADVKFASKAGWTSNSRQEVAFVATKDGETAYVLAVFGNDDAYANDGKIFPRISRLVFKRMRASN